MILARRFVIGFFLLLAGPVFPVSGQAADDDSVMDALRQSADALVGAFNAGKVEDVVSGFLPQGEWIDEHGRIYQGREEITDVLKRYFEKYPHARIIMSMESMRMMGPVAIDEGIRVMTNGEESDGAHIRYLAVRVKTDDGWKIASLRDFGDERPLSPHERLLPLSWLVGDWLNEGSDGQVKISYKWSDDGNYLLSDYLVVDNGTVLMKSEQRIGWDPASGKIRSWMFDSDGGHGGGYWTEMEDGWMVKSHAVTPDGITGSATLIITQPQENRFRLRGIDRIIGDIKDDDFEFEVVRQPPSSGK